ncbi:MAG: sulfatase [Saprospiraceae bacterium]|nr:sulfatase [Saprospiraceae bacterium]
MYLLKIKLSKIASRPGARVRWTLAPLFIIPLLISMGCQPQNVDRPRPNILFAIADDASFPHMGAYGTSWVNTPAFDRVAREGLLFMNAYTPNAKCAPSRACILTGRNSWQLEEACNHWPYFPEKFKTFAETLPQAGYMVGYTAKGWSPGIAKKNGEKRDLIGNPFNKFKTDPPAQFISNNDYAENFRDFLENKNKDQPFFFWYGSTEPHRAYEFGAGIKYGNKKTSDIDQVPEFWPDNDSVRTDILDYAFEIEYFDQHLARMISILEEKGLLENTLVVVTADNGMPFPKVKGQMYEMNNHLPLAMMWPEGIEDPGREITPFVNFIDFAPTFLELAGISEGESGMQPMTGRSLIPFLRNNYSGSDNEYRDHTLIGKERHDVGRPNDVGYPVRGIIKDHYLYVENFKPERWPAGNPETGYLNCDGSPTKSVILNQRRNGTAENFWQWSFGKRPDVELYKIDEDPYCINNLAGDESTRSIRERLRAQLYSELEQQDDPRILGKGEIFDQYPDASSAAGFYERFMQGENVTAGWVNESDFEPILKEKN